MLTQLGNSAMWVANCRIVMLLGCGCQSYLSLGMRLSILRVVSPSCVISFTSASMIFMCIIFIGGTKKNTRCDNSMSGVFFCEKIFWNGPHSGVKNFSSLHD